MKYFGKVGYKITEETAPGIHTPVIVEHEHYGDIIQSSRRWTQLAEINDGIAVNTQIEIIADDFANIHHSQICYVTYMGAKWKVSSLSFNRPRITLTLGGIYAQTDL